MRFHYAALALLLGALQTAAAASDCVSLTGSATAWDAVTKCSGVYAAFTNSDAKIAEGAASVKVVATAEAVDSFDACATNCFAKKKCQWFKVESATDGSNKKCSYYQHLALSQASSSGAAKTTISQFGFVLAGDADFLDQNIDDTSAVFQLGGYSFYKSVDDSSKALSMYISSASATCAAVPLTLYRSYVQGYQTSTMVTNAASGKTINSMDSKFTLDFFLSALKNGTSVNVDMPTDAVNVDSSGNVVRTGKAGTTYHYALDKSGRVTIASGSLSYANVLRKPGQLSKNTAGTSVRDQYCVPAYQSQYNKLQKLTAATSAGLPFQAGHVFGCQFSNPQSFFNFVPQSANSNARNGCWYNTELSTSRLLKMGCSGDLQAQMTYFTTPGDISEISSFTGPLMNASSAKSLYTTTGNDNSLQVQRPCGYWYRPVKMSLDFTVTGATAGSRCSLALNPLTTLKGKFYTVDASAGAMTINRAFAHWSYENPQYYRLRGMATADWRQNQCYAETGTLLTTMTFTNDFDRTFLKVKVAASTAANATCVSTTSAGVLQVGICDTTGAGSRWSSAGTSSSSKLINSASPSCIHTTADATCVQPEFRYVKATVSFSGSAADVTSGDDLADGYVYAGTKCLVQSGSTLAFAASTSCSVFQATYTLDTSDVDDAADDS